VRHISDRIAVMYLGRMVEIADAEEIYTHPQHPYSKALLSSVPLPDPRLARAQQRIPLNGNNPSALKLPSGCPFRLRCPYASGKCMEYIPELKQISPGHFAACHEL
jgi:oligopeptide transport system ATP-binding protein